MCSSQVGGALFSSHIDDKIIATETQSMVRLNHRVVLFFATDTELTNSAIEISGCFGLIFNLRHLHSS